MVNKSDGNSKPSPPQQLTVGEFVQKLPQNIACRVGEQISHRGCSNVGNMIFWIKICVFWTEIERETIYSSQFFRFEFPPLEFAACLQP